MAPEVKSDNPIKPIRRDSNKLNQIFFIVFLMLIATTTFIYIRDKVPFYSRVTISRTLPTIFNARNQIQQERKEKKLEENSEADPEIQKSGFSYDCRL